MVVSVTLTELSRNKLGIVVAILSAVMSLAGISLIAVGIFIQVYIDDTLILLESYNPDVLPHFLVSVGTIMLLLNVVSAKLAYDCGFSITREKYRVALVPVLIVMFVFIWIVLAAGSVTLSRRASVEDALHNGLIDSMKRYKGNLAVKVALDKLQMRSRCCGSKTYKEWFDIGWINTEYVKTDDPSVSSKMRNGNLYTDAVPFSCCDVTVLRPCIMHSVNSNNHKNYKGVTLYKNGCTKAMMDDFENRILQPTGSVVIILFAAQTVVLVLLRYLQTSIEDANLQGDPEGPGNGYLLPSCIGACRTGNINKYKEGALAVIRNKKRPMQVQDTEAGGADESGADEYGGGGYGADGGEDSGALGNVVDMISGLGGGGADGGEGGGGGKEKKSSKEKKGNKESKEKSSKTSDKKDKSSKKDKSKSSDKSSKKSKSKSPDKSSKKSKSKSPDKSSKKSKSKSPSKSKSKSPKRSRSPKASKSPKKTKSPKRSKSPKRAKGGGKKKR